MNRFPAILLLFLPALALADWPGFRGPTGLGTSDEKGVPTTWGPSTNIAWKSSLPGPGTSTPVTFGDKIFVTCYSAYMGGRSGGSMDDLKLHVVCLNRADGKELWKRDVAPRLPEQAEIREGHGYASGTPAVDAERVYCPFGKTGVVAFTHDGKQLWTATVGDGLSGWGSAACPLVVGDLVIVNASVESESLVALDKATGKERWRAKGIRESWSMPVLVTPKGGKPELVVAMLGKVLGIDPTNGEQLWSCKTDITWYMVPTPVAHDGIVYAIGGRSGVVALAVKAGGRGEVTETHRLWTGRKGSNVSSPIFHDGHLYWMNDNSGTVFCAEAETGKIVYEERLDRPDQVYASPVLVGGNLYYFTRSGAGVVVAAKPKFEVVATNERLERAVINASPAVAGGKLLVRTDRHLYCIGK